MKFFSLPLHEKGPCDRFNKKPTVVNESSHAGSGYLTAHALFQFTICDRSFIVLEHLKNGQSLVFIFVNTAGVFVLFLFLYAH